MRGAIAGLVLFCLLACRFTPTMAQKTMTPAEIDAMLKDMQRRNDSLMHSDKVQNFLKQGKAINADSIARAAKDRKMPAAPGMMGFGSMPLIKPDTTTEKLPPKNIQALGAVPARSLSTAAIKDFANDLDKKLTAGFQKAYGTVIVNTDKYNVTAITNAAVVASEMGLLDQALLLSLKAVEREPGNGLALNNAGAILHKGGLEVAAICFLQAAAETDPGNNTVENNLGQAYLGLGDRDKAQQHLQTCVAKAPYHPLANTSLALIELERGDRSSALSHVENSLRGSFTDRGWHLLYKLKKDPVLMDYFKARYKQPEYFNENKYRVPVQCENVADIPRLEAEYDAYHRMLDRVKKQFDDEQRTESQEGTKEMMQKMRNVQPGFQLSKYEAPMQEMAAAMMLDLKMRWEREDADKIMRVQKTRDDRMKQLGDEYSQAERNAKECSEQISLANEYMQKYAVVQKQFQRDFLRIYDQVFSDNAFWTFFSTNNAHMRRALFCQVASGYLSQLSAAAHTAFLHVRQDCMNGEKKQKEEENIKIEGNCPLGEDGVEIPFGFGKYSLNCEESEFQIGELIVVNLKHKFSTGETIFAIGPGVSLSILGSSHESLGKIPSLGPIKPGLEAGITGQFFWTFKEGSMVDYGGKIETELDVLGWGREFKTGVSISEVDGLQMNKGIFKDFIDENVGPPKEVQQNKNVKIYNPK
jgi:tetratricopeptide (TPR) repeat protein